MTQKRDGPKGNAKRRTKNKQTQPEAGRTAGRTWQAKQNGEPKADEPSARERERILCRE